MRTAHGLVLTLASMTLLSACKDRAAPVTATPDPTPDRAPTARKLPAGNVTRTPAAVKETFARFITATKSRRGADAEACVDADTIATFANVRNLALNAGRDELKRKGFGTKFQVILVRAVVSRPELEAVAADHFFAWSIDRGRAGSSPMDLGDVHITGDTATADLMAFGKPSGITVPFVAENGTWRFRHSEFNKLADEGSREIMTRSKLPEDEWLTTAIGRSLGKQLPDTIWDKMQ